MKLPTPNIHHSLKYNPHLDGLRGIAILLVIFFHFFPNFVPFGFVGVDIFFLLSGFLITTIILKKLEENKFSLKEFYRNRVRRLFPALIFALFLTLLVGYLFLFPKELTDLGKHVKSTSFYYENFRLMNEIGYWDKESLLKPLLHMWSLSIEEQFYLFWPFILFILHKFTKSNKNNLIIIVFILFLFLFFLSVYLSSINVEKNFYNTFARAWELVFGGLLGLLLIYYKKYMRKFFYMYKIFFKYSTLLLILLPLILFNIEEFSPLRLIILLFLVFLVVYKVSFSRDVILGNKLLIFFGLISYSLYIWHYILLSFIHIFGLDTFKLKIITLILVIFISIFSFYFIELPLRKNNNYNLTIYLTLTLITIGLVGSYINAKNGLPNRPIVKQSKNIDFSREKPRDKNCLYIAKSILNKQLYSIIVEVQLQILIR